MRNEGGALRSPRPGRVDTPVSGIAWIGRVPAVEPPTSVPVAPTSLALGPALADLAAMRREEMLRLRHFALWGAILCASGLVLQHFHNEHAILRPLMTVALIAFGSTSTWLWYSARNPSDYTKVRHRLKFFGCVAVVTSFVMQLRMGLFSPITVVIVFGLNFFGRSENRKLVFLLAGTSIALYFGAGMLMSFDVIADPGVINSALLPRAGRAGVVVMTTAIYVVTLVQARHARASAENMLAVAKAAAQEARSREVQLQEANQNLDRALKAASGLRGRYTDTSAGSWTIGEVVGRGAMGEVYAARHAVTRAPAAVKLLHATPATFGDDPAPRFLREARVAASLRAPNLVTVYEVGEAEDGAPFMAMELLAGNDLAWKLRRTPRLPLGEVVRMVKEIAAGLAVAHSAGVIHRDLKPQNLFLDTRPTRAGRWKILDFGICTLTDSSGTLTADGIVGTPAYMAPEQARGERIDARADLFALGAVVYRCLTGLPAFTGPAAPQVLYAVAFEQPTRPGDLDPAIPSAVESVLAIALSKDPRDRFASAAAMAEALERAASGEIAPALRDRAAAILAARPWKALPTKL